MTNTDDQIRAARHAVRCVDALTGFVESIEQADSTLDMIGCVRLVELGADQARQAIVQLARAEGRTWEEIGDAVGTTRQAAQQRFGL